MWTLIRRLTRRTPPPVTPPRHRQRRDPHDPLHALGHSRPSITRAQWLAGEDYNLDTDTP